MADFTWVPSSATSGDVEPRAAEIEFGDGYRQAAADGINAARDTWTLVFDPIPSATLADIESFLATKGSWQQFTWRPPAPWDGADISVVWRRSQRGNLKGAGQKKLTLTFERRYAA